MVAGLVHPEFPQGLQDRVARSRHHGGICHCCGGNSKRDRLSRDCRIAAGGWRLFQHPAAGRLCAVRAFVAADGRPRCADDDGAGRRAREHGIRQSGGRGFGTRLDGRRHVYRWKQASPRSSRGLPVEADPDRIHQRHLHFNHGGADRAIDRPEDRGGRSRSAAAGAVAESGRDSLAVRRAWR